MRRVWMAAGAVALAACAASMRPGYAPLPEARADTIAAPPAAVVEALIAGVAEAGMRIQWQSPAEGFVETQWYNLVTRESGAFDRSNVDRFVRLRFFVDPVGTDRSVVRGESVLLRSIDQSRPERDREMMVPQSHAGYALLTRVLESARTALR